MGPFLQRIAMDCHCVVVSVDYRLAPETKFPGSLEDNYAALRWAHSNAEMLGIDRKRIAVGGESAGGGHAAALAIHARDRGEIPIAFQMLIYPMLDDRTGSTRPAPLAVGKFVWIAESNRFGWTALLGVPAGSADVPKGSVPARVDSVAGLPPAYIGVGSIDLFVNEDIEYARRISRLRHISSRHKNLTMVHRQLASSPSGRLFASLKNSPRRVDVTSGCSADQHRIEFRA
jgi:acetyl esterase/lipase